MLSVLLVADWSALRFPRTLCCKRKIPFTQDVPATAMALAFSAAAYSAIMLPFLLASEKGIPFIHT